MFNFVRGSLSRAVFSPKCKVSAATNHMGLAISRCSFHKGRLLKSEVASFDGEKKDVDDEEIKVAEKEVERLDEVLKDSEDLTGFTQEEYEKLTPETAERYDPQNKSNYEDDRGFEEISGMDSKSLERLISCITTSDTPQDCAGRYVQAINLTKNEKLDEPGQMLLGEMLNGHLDLTVFHVLEQDINENIVEFFSFIDKVPYPNKDQVLAERQMNEKEKIMYAWKKMGKTRDEIKKLIKSGEGDRIIRRMTQYEATGWSDLITGTHETKSAVMHRLTCFVIYANLLDIMNNHGFYSWSLRLVKYALEAAKKHMTSVDRYSLLLVEYNRLRALLATGFFPPSVIDEVFSFFKEMDAYQNYINQIFASEAGNPQIAYFQQRSLEMRSILYRLIMENIFYSFDGNLPETFERIDRITNHEQKFKQVHAASYQMLKSLLCTFTGDPRFLDFMKESFGTYNEFSAIKHSSQIVKEDFLFLESGGAIQAGMLGIYDEEDYRSHLHSLIDHSLNFESDLSLSANISNIEFRNPHFDGILGSYIHANRNAVPREAVQYLNFAIYMSKQDEFYTTSMPHFLVKKANFIIYDILGEREDRYSDSIHAEMRSQLASGLDSDETNAQFSNYFENALDLSMLQKGMKNPDMIHICEQYARYLNFLGDFQSANNYLRTAEDIKETLGFTMGRMLSIQEKIVTTLNPTFQKNKDIREEYDRSTAEKVVGAKASPGTETEYGNLEEDDMSDIIREWKKSLSSQLPDIQKQ